MAYLTTIMSHDRLLLLLLLLLQRLSAATGVDRSADGDRATMSRTSLVTGTRHAMAAAETSTAPAKL